MPKARQANFVGQGERHDEAVALLSYPGDYGLVNRGVLRSMVMACPDGCGEIITVNLDPRSGKAWRIYRRARAISLFPSVWRDDGCGAHFILWRNRIIWCMLEEQDDAPPMETPLMEQVLRLLPSNKFVYFDEIAHAANLNPWEVLWACEGLVLERRAERGSKRTFKAKGGPR